MATHGHCRHLLGTTTQETGRLVSPYLSFTARSTRTAISSAQVATQIPIAMTVLLLACCPLQAEMVSTLRPFGHMCLVALETVTCEAIQRQTAVPDIITYSVLVSAGARGKQLE